MSVDRDESGESFLKRWSRVKSESREAAEAPPVGTPSVAAKLPAAESPMPELPPIEKLTVDSDFSGFFHPKVDEDLRRKALRKLFSDPHFNVMDGLDVYIDDYSKMEPIPAAMLASLRQAQRIFEWAAEKKEEASGARSEPAPSDGAAEPDLASPAALEDSSAHCVPPAVVEAESAPSEEDARVLPPGTS